MRTKLDEIVEEELSTRRACGGFEPLNESCARIAERAFRHGVEQTSERVAAGHTYGVNLHNIRPAAVEKKRGFENCVIKMREGETLDASAPYLNGYTIRPNEECGIPDHKTWPGGAWNETLRDRRKGQRRKDTEGFRMSAGACTAKPNSYHKDFWVRDVTGYVCNRRIKDRRKA